MSFSVGIFDLFSYAIPGFVYVFIVNEILKLTNISQLDMFKMNEATTIVILTGLAYIAGILLSRVAKQWYLLWVRKSMEAEALQFVIKHHPDIHNEFKQPDWPIIFSAIKRDHFELYNQINREKALSVMLYNLSFGFLLFSLLEAFYFIYYQNAAYLLVCAGTLIASILALNLSRSHTMWFYREIFEQGLFYGHSLEALLNKVRAGSADEPANKTKRKTA